MQMMSREANNVNSLIVAPVEIKWHLGMPIFASETFLRTVGDEYGWIGGTDASGQLRCALPYIVVRKLGFRMVRFRVETIPLKGELDAEEEKSFLNSAIEYFRSTGADMIIPANNTALFRTYPDGAVAAPYGTVIKDLSQPEEILFNEVHADYRKKIRSAARAGVQIRYGMQYLDTSYNLIADTLQRSGAPFITNYDDFKRSVLGLGENVRIFIADYQGAIQACLVTPFSEYSAYTWYGGTISEPLKGAMHLLHWEAIRQFRGMGIKHFNFTGLRINPERGSKQEGIMTFKMRFGGRLVQGYMWKYSLHPFKFAAYCLAVRLLKGGDIVDVEHHKLTAG